MSQTVLYITSNPMKRRTVERFIRQHVPDFRIASREVAFYEPQTLDEPKVISYKALEAWKIFRRPLLVDDAGFYLDEYEGFPGPLAKPTVISLGWEGMLKLAAPSYRARVYCRLGYVDQAGMLHHYRGETTGVLDKNMLGPLVDRRGVYALLRPDDSSITIAEMAGTPQADFYSPRARALRAFVKNALDVRNMQAREDLEETEAESGKVGEESAEPEALDAKIVSGATPLDQDGSEPTGEPPAESAPEAAPPSEDENKEE